MNEFAVVLVALYQYRNFPLRIMHPLLEDIDGVKPYTIFFKNCATNVFSRSTLKEEALFIKLITELNPKLVGFSVLSPYLSVAKRLTRLVKDNSSSAVIWGGIHPTISPEDCINEADMLCVGEGEGAIVDLARHLLDGRSCRSINNLWVKNGGDIVKNPMRPLIQDLDSIPFPSYGNDSYYFIDSNKITKDDPLLLDNYFWVQASRGCPCACSYCVNSLLRPLFKDLGPYTRRRSVGSVTREIKENLSLPGSRTDFVFFVDEVFGNEESWLDEFVLQYKRDVGIPFFAACNPKLINSAMLGKLASAGISTIGFGIEACSDYIRNQIFHRTGKNSEIVKLSREIAGLGIKIYYDLIIDNPYDSEQSLRNAIELLFQLPKPLFFNLYSLQYFPGYPLTKKAIEDGFIRPEEARADNLIAKITRNWAYTPRLFPYTERQILQNIIWLIVWNHVEDNIVRFCVFGDSWRSRLCLNYLNLKSIILGRIFGVGGIIWKNPWLAYLIKGIKCILTGDFKTLGPGIKKHILRRPQ